MTREQAINSMISHGFTVEQAGEIIKAVTPQFSSGLDKNSKKLEKDFGELDCISREQAKAAIRDKFKDLPSRVEINTILNELPSVTPQPCEDAVSRQEVLDLIADYDLSMGQVVRGIHALPSVTPQEPQTFRWCTTCKEYDQEKHCCHRWSKVIRDTVQEMKQEPRWIPVSEKLPEPFTFVNATCRSLVDDRENWVVETIYSPIPKEANIYGYSDWGNIPMLNWGEAEVIAWVERIIPQPYKAEIEPQESEDKE